MFRFTAAFLLCLTTCTSLIQNDIMVQGAELEARLLHTLSASNENSDMSSTDDQAYPPINNDDDVFPWGLGEEGCDEQWPQTKLDYEANMQENWENLTCYSYEFQYIIFSDPEVLRPIRVSVVDGIVDHVEDVEDPSFTPSPYIPRLTMNDIFDEIKENCFQDCPEKGAPECSVQYDPLHGNVKDLYINDSLMISDMFHFYHIMNFLPCEE